MMRYDMSYLYHGNFSTNLTDSILSFSETCLDTIGESTKVRKKVYFIMVESLQNITRHEERIEQLDADRASYFVLQGINNGYFITSGNFIKNEAVKHIKSRIDMVNSLDPDSLKLYQQEVLESGTMSDKGGAGLGLIEMARKSGNKLKYEFSDADKTHSYFYSQIKVTSEKDSPDVDQKYDDNFINAKTTHEHLLQNKINIVYQGGFNNENVQGILTMINAAGDGNSSSFSISDKAYQAISELLKNIYLHADCFEIDADSKPGIFMLGSDKDSYQVVTGNLVKKLKSDALLAKMKDVLALDSKKIEEKYKQLMKSAAISKKQNVGAGFYLMSLISNNLIDYSLQPVSDEFDFFTFSVKVKAN